jgi:hypothetical protein
VAGRVSLSPLPAHNPPLGAEAEENKKRIRKQVVMTEYHAIMYVYPITRRK